MNLVIASNLSLGRKRDEESDIEFLWRPGDQLDEAIRNAADLKTYALLQELRSRVDSGVGLMTR